MNEDIIVSTDGTGDRDPSGARAEDEETSFFGQTRPVYVIPEATDEPGQEDELESEFAPQPRRRLGLLTVLLAGLLVAGAGFLVGVQVQKHQSSTTAAGTAANRRGTGITGFTPGGAGGFGGGALGGAGGGAGAGAAGGTGGTGGTGGAGGTAAIPAVIGQIVSVTGDTVVVKNLGGKLITVKLSAGTKVTQAATAADLKAGQTVTVSGTTEADGTVTATTVGGQ
jgi:hypothetical protein